MRQRNIDCYCTTSHCFAWCSQRNLQWYVRDIQNNSSLPHPVRGLSRVRDLEIPAKRHLAQPITTAHVRQHHGERWRFHVEPLQLQRHQVRDSHVQFHSLKHIESNVGSAQTQLLDRGPRRFKPGTDNSNLTIRYIMEFEKLWPWPWVQSQKPPVVQCSQVGTIFCQGQYIFPRYQWMVFLLYDTSWWD